MHKQIFVNLPVKDLPRSKAFFEALGLSFNPQFTNDQGACLVIGENICAMLLTREFFKSFIDKQIA
ncbi:MAG: glyoxalase/bleomycin resistance/extradiol dioxygenase family protein, partial [Caldimonas sp.]